MPTLFKKYLSSLIEQELKECLAGVNDKPIIDKRNFRPTPYEGYLIGKNGDVYSQRRNIILSPRLDKDGYLEVSLMVGKDTVSKTVHRLVADAWLPNPKKLPYVNHKNGNRDDNRVENLEWVSVSENNLKENQNNGRKYVYDGKRINREKSHLPPKTRT